MSAEILTPREQLRVQISSLPEIFDDDPSRWWFRSYLYLRKQMRSLPNLPPEIQETMGPFIAMASELVKKEVGESAQGDAVQRAEAIIMKVSYEMAKRFEPKIESIVEHVITLDSMVSSQPDIFRIRDDSLGIKIPDTSDFYYIKLPSQNKIWYKGGVSRVLLNILVGADKEVILSDLPPNDHDGIAVGGFASAHEEAARMGIDADGLEMSKGETLDFARFCLGRDSTQNQVVFGLDGLHFSDAAYEAARSGYTRIVGKYIPEKAIYGVDVAYIRGVEVVKPRGQMRLIKALSEGKIQSFEHKPVSSALDIGLYVMFLAKRWSKKTNFPELLQNMYEVLRRMGHVRKGEKQIFDVLKRAHQDYPFFEFKREIKDIVEVVEWKSRKLVKQVDREFAWINKDQTGFVIERKPGDTDPLLITLKGFTPDKSLYEKTHSKWNKYLKYCEKEYKTYQSLKLTPLEKLFNKSDKIDFEDIGLGKSESGIFVEGEEEI